MQRTCIYVGLALLTAGCIAVEDSESGDDVLSSEAAIADGDVVIKRSTAASASM